jgi:hypothetical protein
MFHSREPLPVAFIETAVTRDARAMSFHRSNVMNESTDKTTASRIRSRASNIKQRVKQDGKEKIESGKRAAADQIEEVADAIDAAGMRLDESQPTLANYAAKLADGVGGLATRLREDSVEDIYRDVRRVATQHPGLFLLGSAALGLVISRFMKASASESDLTESTGGGDEGLSFDTQDENAQDFSRTGSDVTDGSLYGQSASTSTSSASGIGDIDEEDLDALRPGGRESSTSNPYGSPNVGA